MQYKIADAIKAIPTWVSFYDFFMLNKLIKKYGIIRD